MLHPSRRFRAAALVLLAGWCQIAVVEGSTTATPTTTALQSTGTCEARTINYITDSLPQQCLRKEWNGFSNGTGGSITTPEGLEGAANTTTITVATKESPSPSSTSAEAADASATDLESGELGEASFLSFEEWKKQTLEKAGQANANIGTKKSADGKKRDVESFRNDLDSLGDEGEIDLDFSSFRSGGKGEDANQVAESGDAGAGQENQEVEESGRKKEQYRSKDAGITCKERFSYASFDAGATILKTHPGAKNSKAVLIENKDSYMLSECSAKNKFIIIELSEDIWIDTVVLANYEFFSSQIRTFRVSVSDRYPVKIDKWKDVGTYEAKNSREIQAFLIANPQIWARYIRIEFLTHYGNEYYCPLSLVRVHGTRMLESWKETEANNDEDEGETEGEEAFIPDAVAEVLQEEEKLRAAAEEILKVAQTEQASTSCDHDNKDVSAASEDSKTTPWVKFSFFDVASPNWLEDACLPGEAPIEASSIAVPTATANLTSTTSVSHATIPTSSSATETIVSNINTPPPSSKVESPITSGSTIKESSTLFSVPSNSTGSTENSSSVSAPPASKSQNATSTPKNKTTSTSSATSSLPTIQESFFKAVSRRLNFLETNSTLSLKYIEEQSRILREAFTKVEKKQLQKTTTFLDTLNSTVLDELRHFRQQYDEIWQSTVISLESQREESRREILAISSRLNILADEVVFQKRMSIVQSVLVLLCLGLVIFTHVSGGGHLDYANMNNRMRFMSGTGMESPIESPPHSPEYMRTDPMRTGRPWLEVDDRRRRSDEMIGSRSRSRGDQSPQTSMSEYSHSEEVAMTPLSGPDDVFVRSEAELPALPVEEDDLPNQEDPPLTYYPAEYLEDLTPAIPGDIIITPPAIPVDGPPEVPPEISPKIPPQSPARTPKKRKPSIRQTSSPPVSGAEESFTPDLTLSPTPEPQPISQLEFPNEVLRTSSPPHFSKSTSSLDLSQALPPRLPSPPPESWPPPEPSLHAVPNGHESTNENDTGIAVPLSDDNNRHSMPSLSRLQSSPSPHASPSTQAQVSNQSSPVHNGHRKRQSFSIARKPLPALPGDS